MNTDKTTRNLTASRNAENANYEEALALIEALREQVESDHLVATQQVDGGKPCWLRDGNQARVVSNLRDLLGLNG